MPARAVWSTGTPATAFARPAVRPRCRTRGAGRASVKGAIPSISPASIRSSSCWPNIVAASLSAARSEERRVGKEGGSRGSADREREKQNTYGRGGRRGGDLSREAEGTEGR